MDDMLVKSMKEGRQLDDLLVTFVTLCLYDMKLDTNKCVLEVSSGKFISFMVLRQGVKANPDKI